MGEDKAAQDEMPSITAREGRDIDQRSGPRTPVIYHVVRKFGEEEMARPAVSLWWSGFAAGLSLSLSTLAQAVLQLHLPDTSWRPLVSAFGYSLGFVIVVLSRQQLFTENTLSVVLPVLASPTLHNFLQLLRLWSLVFVANMAGAFFAAAFYSFTSALSPELFTEMLKDSAAILGPSWPEMLFRGVAAGYLMAAMVWLLPGAENAQVSVIVMMTWLIAAGQFMHIVAGGVEGFLLLLHGDFVAPAMALNFVLPVLIGNILGGTGLFALIAYAQVMQEL